MSAPSQDDPAGTPPPPGPRPAAPPTTDAPTPPAPAAGADDERLDLWLDERLPDEERARFEQELDQDPAQKREAQTLASLLATVRNLPDERAPTTLLSDIQQTLRSRTHGRHFSTDLRARFPYEALLQALLLVGALVIFAISAPEPPKLVPVEPKDFLVAGSELGVAARTLGDFGVFRNEHVGVDDKGWKHLVGEVPNERLEALKTEISLYPSMRLDSEEPLEGGRTRVRVAVRP